MAPLSSPDQAGILFPAVPAGILFSVGPVGLCGTLSPSDSNSAILVDPGGALPSSDLAWRMVLSASTELLSVVAVPFPAGRDPAIAQLPAEGWKGNVVLSYITALPNTAGRLFRKLL